MCSMRVITMQCFWIGFSCAFHLAFGQICKAILPVSKDIRRLRNLHYFIVYSELTDSCWVFQCKGVTQKFNGYAIFPSVSFPEYDKLYFATAVHSPIDCGVRTQRPYKRLAIRKYKKISFQHNLYRRYFRLKGSAMILFYRKNYTYCLLINSSTYNSTEFLTIRSWESS